MKIPGMLKRLPTMLIWLVAAGFTTFDAPELSATVILFGLVGVGFVMLLYVLWGQRTRPAKNAFWFLVHVVLIGAIIALGTSRPLLGFVVAIPVTLLWIHDAPGSPTAMLSWGMVLILWQPDLWSGAEAEVSWDVVLATMLMIAAAQFERNRLAARQYTQAGIIFSFIRLGLVGAITMLFVAGREGLRAVNVFTYLGIDASGVGGKMTMLGFIFISIAAAVFLFRVRPDKPQLTVAAAEPGRPSPRAEPARKPIDFDEAPEKVHKRVDRVTDTTKRITKAAEANRQQAATRKAKAAGKPAPKPKPKGAAKPGELDFD